VIRATARGKLQPRILPHQFGLSSLNFRPKAPTDDLKLALNFSLAHIRALDVKNKLKCYKVFKALKFR
jgi:hypothetical protein